MTEEGYGPRVSIYVSKNDELISYYIDKSFNVPYNVIFNEEEYNIYEANDVIKVSV